MNRKLVLSLVLALAIFTTVFCAGIPGQAQAINVTPGGSNGKLFKQTSGTVTIGGITENGVEIVLDGSYTDNKFQFVQNMYMDGFAFEAQTNLYFDSFTLTVSDYSDADNVAEITVTKETQEGSKVFYGTVKNGNLTGIRTEIPFTPVDSEKTSDGDKYGLTISYEDGVFSVNGVKLLLPEVAGASEESGEPSEGEDQPTDPVEPTYRGIYFDSNVATMTFANKNNEQNDEISMEMLVKSISNVNGKQELTTEAEAVDIVIWTRLTKPEATEISDETLYHGRKTAYVYGNIKAKQESDYSFPVYGISIIGQTMDTQVFEILEDGSYKLLLSSFEDDENGSSDNKKSKYRLGKDGQKYEIRLYNATEVHVLRVDAIQDKVPTELNHGELHKLIDENLTKGAFRSNQNITLPKLTISDGNSLDKKYFIFSEEDQGIDTIDNIKVQVAYKKPGATGDWSWSSNFTISSLTAEGTWAFAYRVVDGSGNAGKDIFTFTRDVIDAKGPEITLSSEQLSAYKGVRYTVSTPTISDDISGVDTSKTSIRVFKGVRGNADVEEIKLYNDNSFVPDVLTGKSESYSYYVEYVAYDYRGNKSEVKYAYITVTEKKDDNSSTTAEVPGWLFVILIVACVLLIAAIVYLIFSKPEEKNTGRPEPKQVESKDEQKK